MCSVRGDARRSIDGSRALSAARGTLAPDGSEDEEEHPRRDARETNPHPDGRTGHEASFEGAVTLKCPHGSDRDQDQCGDQLGEPHAPPMPLPTRSVGINRDERRETRA